ncbi:MAG: hypothetical protein KC931_11505 [Candidatus Omnitrophica bacterium]|nr:hypothetical protein [Candidatus Omnitrophota bacterium]
MSDDPSSTYRGFRSQALYVLHRLLTDPDRAGLVFRPEGDEDLAIYDRQGVLIEAIQVKDHSSPLALSDLNYKTDQGFFGRLRNRIAKVPDCKTRIAMYGPLGPELLGAIEGEDKPRRDVVRKIKSGLKWRNEGEIADALQRLKGNVERLDRGKLTKEIEERLEGTAIGGDIAAAMDLLMYWVFDASERSRDITEKLFVGKIQEIGDFLVQSRNFSAEWGTSIHPVRTEEIQPERRAELVAEYRSGRDARFEHILANADAPRQDLLSEIREGFAKHLVIVVRGTAGQGKSSLGWRYLHDLCADGLRFQIRILESQAQAMRIASALGIHVRKLQLPATVFIDVLPSTVGWAELAIELSRFGIRALVCVREEDFLRGGRSRKFPARLESVLR